MKRPSTTDDVLTLLETQVLSAPAIANWLEIPQSSARRILYDLRAKGLAVRAIDGNWSLVRENTDTPAAPVDYTNDPSTRVSL